MRRATEDKENTKEDLNAPIRRTIRIRSIKESQGRKRLFSQEASRGSGLNTEDDAPPNTCDKKLYGQVKTKGSHDKVFSWNLTDYQSKSPTVESKKVDMKKVSKLAQLLKIQS